MAETMVPDRLTRSPRGEGSRRRVAAEAEAHPGAGRFLRVAALLVGLAISVSRSHADGPYPPRMAGDPLPAARSAAAPGSPAAEQDESASRAYLPMVLKGRLDREILLAATARAATAQAATATAAARPSATQAPSTSPTATAPVGGSPTPDGSPSPSPSPSASPATPSATAASPTATEPGASPTAMPTPTSTLAPSPTVSPTPREPAGEGLRPLGASQAGAGTVGFDAAAGVYQLTHRGAITVSYELDLRHPDNQRGRLTLRERMSNRFPIAGAGLYYREADGTLIEPRLISLVGDVDRIEHQLLPEGDGLSLTVHETLDGRAQAKRYTLRLRGRALLLRAESLVPGGVPEGQGGYAGFTAGDIEGSHDGVSLRLPYMDAVPITMLDHRWFAGSLLDYPASQANLLQPRGPEALPGAFTHEVAALYQPDAAGRIRPVDERLWIVLSPQVEDAFPVPEHPPSPYRAWLTGRLHVSLEGRGPGAGFADWAAYLAMLRGWGLEDLVVHLPRWEADGVLRPAQGPPDPAAGGAPAFATLAAAAHLAPTLAYSLTVAGCPEAANPLYRPADRVTGADGAAKQVGDRACGDGSRAGAFLLAPDAARRLAGGAAGELAGWGARGLDLATLPAWNPAWPWPGAAENVLDQAAPPAHPAEIGSAVLAYKRLFADLQARLGPVFGPGAPGLWDPGFESFYAGYLDGSPRPLATGSLEGVGGADYLVIPDYELAVVRPRMLGYGMGGYAQFFGEHVLDNAGRARPLSEAEIDEWQASTLAYGHAGAWQAWRPDAQGDALSLADQVKTYYLMRAIQPRLLGESALAVAYLGRDGRPHDLSWAVAQDMDLAGPRLRLSNDEGTELWINHSPDLWTVTAAGTAYQLPTHGWLLRGAGGLLGYSALVEGRRADYLRAPEWLLLDGRGRLTDFGGVAARDLLVRLPDGRRIEEQPDGSLRWSGP